jgi:hypothetical protein
MSSAIGLYIGERSVSIISYIAQPAMALSSRAEHGYGHGITCSYCGFKGAFRQPSLCPPSNSCYRNET